MHNKGLKSDFVRAASEAFGLVLSKVPQMLVNGKETISRQMPQLHIVNCENLLLNSNTGELKP
jgi:hypothetical protein